MNEGSPPKIEVILASSLRSCSRLSSEAHRRAWDRAVLAASSEISSAIGDEAVRNTSYTVQSIADQVLRSALFAAIAVDCD